MTTELQAEARRIRDEERTPEQRAVWAGCEKIMEAIRTAKIDAMRSRSVLWTPPEESRVKTLPPLGEGHEEWTEGLNDAVYNAPNAATSPLYCEGYQAGLHYLQCKNWVNEIDALIEGV